MAALDATAGTPAQQMGQCLRQAREAAGLDVTTVAARLRMQKTLILALEAGDWSRLGAPVFVRGHLRSYARLLGIELDGLDDISLVPAAPVVPMLTSRPPWFGRLGTRLVYVVITVLVGVPAWMAAQRHLSAPEQPLAVALEIPAVQPALPASGHDETPAAPVIVPTPPAPLTAASLLPPPAPTPSPASALPPAPAASAQHDVSLHVREDSWVELYAADGSLLEQNLLKAGAVRHFAHGQLGRVVIGNFQGVEVRVQGQLQDLSAYHRSKNVARFAVSSDGVIGPVLD